MSTNSPKPLAGLDILKFVMAILVVAIHTEAFGYPMMLSRIMTPITDVAVPTFFLISSYLLFTKIRNIAPPNTEKAILIKFTYRIGVLYAFWFILQLPIVIYTKHYLDYSICMIPCMIVKDVLLGSTFHGAWFLTALVTGIWIIFVLKRIQNEKSIWIIPLIMAVFAYHPEWLGMNAQSCWEIYNQFVINPQNSILVSLIWISLGYILSNSLVIEKLKSIDSNMLLFLFLVGWIFDVFDIEMRIFMVLSIFIIALKSGIEYKPIYKSMRQSSILVFIVHFIIISCMRFIFSRIETLQHGIVQFIITLLASIGISIFILWLKDKPYFNWLKYSF